MTTSQSRDSRGGGRPGTRRFSGRRRRQCVCKEVGTISYKDVSVLRRFISDRGRIESGRKSGNCAKCQRELSTAISRARFLALLPYAPDHIRVTGSITPAAAPAEESEAAPADDAGKPEAETTESAPASAEAAADEAADTGSAEEEKSDDESADESTEEEPEVESTVDEAEVSETEVESPGEEPAEEEKSGEDSTDESASVASDVEPAEDKVDEPESKADSPDEEPAADDSEDDADSDEKPASS